MLYAIHLKKINIGTYTSDSNLCEYSQQQESKLIVLIMIDKQIHIFKT